MRDFFDILDARRRWPDEAMMLATVVRVAGSNFRRTGARMLVRKNGTCIGSVSGGCLEQDVVAHAREMAANPSGPRQLLYDTTVPDDQLFGTGSGCKGRVTILLEHLPPRRLAGSDDWLASAEACLQKGARCCVVSLVDGLSGFPSPHTVAIPLNFAGENLPSVFGIQLPSPEDGPTAFLEGARSSVFVQWVEPQPRILICGAGPTARPLAAICAQVGWLVKVIDWRKGLLDLAPFPSDVLVEHVAAWEKYDFGAENGVMAAVVMTHRWEEDCVAMRGLLQRRLTYLGLMGSHQRCAELLEMLGQNQLSDVASLVVDAPAGVPIGAEGPEEIAVSIAARLISAVRQNRRLAESRGSYSPSLW